MGNSQHDIQSTLNDEQRQAVEFSGKHLLVLAGAGTGKTRTIIARAAHLIDQGVRPNRILILSFTRKSAREIVERIKSCLSASRAEGLIGQTFHSWCMSLIKSNPTIFPFGDHTLLDEDDQESCFKLLCGKKLRTSSGKTVSPANLVDVYSYAINAQCNLSEALRVKLFDNASASLPEVAAGIEDCRPTFAEIIKKYIGYKNERSYIDYDDLLSIVAKGLSANREACDFISRRYDHILVDEMQDTNPLQYKLLKAFASNCHLFCVGDDAQSIYGFRGADFKSIHSFQSVIPDSRVCKLTLNYRSTQPILDLSNWLLSESPLNYDKQLRAARGDGTKPQIIHWDNEWQEANDITDKILDAVTARGLSYADHMVLSRSVWGLRKIEACCIDKKIPYTVYGGTGLMQSKHVRDVASPMRIVANFHDELAWMRYLRLWRGIGEITASRVIAKVIGEPNLDECLEKLSGLDLQKEISATLVSISHMQTMPSSAIATALNNMESRLEEIYKDEWEWRKRDFDVLQDVALDTGSISEFVSQYVLDPKLETTLKDASASEDHVVLTTIHSAKGLESTVCYIANVSTFSFPTNRAILNGEDAIEEERRCLYVAMTRAKDELYLYRDIHSIHIDSNSAEHYFLNNLPEGLADTVVPTGSEQFLQPSLYGGDPIAKDLLDDFDFN